MDTRHYCVSKLLMIMKGFIRRDPRILFIFGITLCLISWVLLIVNMPPGLSLPSVCTSYEKGDAIGNLCQSLCQSRDATYISCHRKNIKKEGILNCAVLKSIEMFDDHDLSNLLDSDHKDSESYFIDMIKRVIKNSFNLTLNDIDAKRMSYIQFSQPGGNRFTEMRNVWYLFQDEAFLALSLYEKYDIFPKLLGTCGKMYAVENLNSIVDFWNRFSLYDSQKEWEMRVKISLMILDFVIYLEEKLPEPMVICNIQIDSFGVTSDFKKIKYLNQHSVHPVSIANKLIARVFHCREHSDCDFNDCRSFCNLITNKCQHGVANNNLQIVCERIFLGWVMSGRIMIPGLLFESKAPPVLIEVLEECANPSKENGIPRSPATKEIRDRLYKLLTHLAV